MKTFEEIEAAIEGLSDVEVERLARGLERCLQNRWGRQLQAESSRLEHFRQEVVQESRAGKGEIPLGEFLGDQRPSQPDFLSRSTVRRDRRGPIEACESPPVAG